MRLMIVRHGETNENKEGIIQGHFQGQLSELGKEQARKLAQRLKNEKIDHIFSSDFDRAKHTAQEVAKFHPKIPFELREGLRERNWGDFQGKKKKDLENWNEIKKDEKKVKEFNAEPLEDMLSRAKKLLKDTLTEDLGKTILFVSHRQFIKALIATLTDKPAEEKNLAKSTSITIFEKDQD